MSDALLRCYFALALRNEAALIAAARELADGLAERIQESDDANRTPVRDEPEGSLFEEYFGETEDEKDEL